MRKTLAFVFALTVLIFSASAFAQVSQTVMTDSVYRRVQLGNSFLNLTLKPILYKADRAIHSPVTSTTLLEAVPFADRVQGMVANVDTALYVYDETDCGVGATSPTELEPDDGKGCWYQIAGAGNIWDALAATTSSSGATLIGIYDTGTYFTGTTVEAALAELGLSRSKLALTTTGNGASLIGVFDDAGYFTGTNVETVLAEVGLELSTSMPMIGTPSVGYFPQITALGTLENSLYQPSDFALASQVGLILTIPVNIASDTIPADPGIDGYRVFMTDTDTTYNEGYVYVWNDTTNVWDAGTLVANGQIVSVKGSVPDTCVGGATATDYVCLSDKGPSPSCKTLTITNLATSATTAADPEWVGITIHTLVPVSGCDQPVTGTSVAGDGAVTVSLAAAATAACEVRFCTFME